MAKKILTTIKMHVPAGKANPAPPVGPTLGQHGVNIMEFCKTFNEQTADKMGDIIPVELLHLYHKDPTGSQPAQESRRYRESLRHT